MKPELTRTDRAIFKLLKTLAASVGVKGDDWDKVVERAWKLSPEELLETKQALSDWLKARAGEEKDRIQTRQ